LDIVQVDGEDVAKRGKFSGVKEVFQTTDGQHKVVASGTEPQGIDSLYEPLIRNGDVVRDVTINNSNETLQESVERVGSGQISSL
jgi:nicotinate phosphoribosyltransferase